MMAESDMDRDEVTEEVLPPRPLDPEVDEADGLDQARPIEPEPGLEPVSSSPEVPEADALEQAMPVPLDADDEAPRDG